jgi:hypothetical protein
MQKAEELKKKLLKLRANYQLLCKRHPEDNWYPDLLEGIELAIIEFNAVFGEETCPIRPIVMSVSLEET